MCTDADADTCAIFVVLGREVLGWDETPPDISQFAVFYRPQGDGYVEQCPWAELGITALPLGRPDPDNTRFFTEPEYSESGRKALVRFVIQRVARGPEGRPQPPFISQERLTLAKADERWVLVDRTLEAIT